jgi:hypothetical protein
MSLLLQTVLGVALLIAPLQSQNIFRDAFDWERRQVELDNLAIELGRADKALFNFVEKQNVFMARLDTAHHALHACARVPGPQMVTCQAKDKAIEMVLRRTMDFTWQKASHDWMHNGKTTQYRYGRLFEKNTEMARDLKVPLVVRRCAVCYLPTRLDVASPPSRTYTEMDPRDPRGIRVRVELFKREQGKWEYALRD